MHEKVIWKIAKKRRACALVFSLLPYKILNDLCAKPLRFADSTAFLTSQASCTRGCSL